MEILVIALLILALIIVAIVYPWKVRDRLTVGFHRHVGDAITVILAIILAVILLQYAA